MAGTHNNNSRSAPSARFLTIDGMRGIACVMVAVYHLSITAGLSRNHEPDNPFAWFGFGIEIFFVISGFVITHSLRNADFSLRYLGLFALRRAIRLDPPYWTIIVMEVILVYVSLKIFTGIHPSLPSPPQFLLHFFYLQSLAGYGHIVPVFWSLCYEFQFYLVLVSCMVVVCAISRHTAASLLTVAFLLGLMMYVVSLATYLGYLTNPLPDFFLNRWYQFMSGSLAWLYLRGKVSAGMVAASCMLTMTAAVCTDTDFWHMSSTVLVGLLCLGLCSLGRRGLLSRLLSGRLYQFLGRISYSLFLIHIPVGSRFIAVWKRAWPGDPDLVMRYVMLGTGLCVSISVAWVLYRLLERPSLELSHRIRLPQHGVSRFE